MSMESRKKRNKDPKPLHQATYKGNKRKNPDRLYTLDPRPVNKRGANIPLMNQFVNNLQTISSQSGPSMWETVFQIKYSDFTINEEEKETLSFQVEIFQNNITFKTDLV